MILTLLEELGSGDGERESLQEQCRRTSALQHFFKYDNIH